MNSVGGGAGPRRGFEYQDIAAAYFFATDKPDFIKKRPLELHIEKPEDFSYTISFDAHDEKHFFEAKHRSDGEFKLRQFYDILEKFSEVANRFSGKTTSIYFHFVSDASFESKLGSLFSDCKDMRKGLKTWNQINNKKIYQKRNVNQFEDNTDLDENIPLAKLIRGLYGHHRTKDGMREGIENFIRECNSPGNFRTPAEKLLREIGKKDSGILRRGDLEQAASISLTKNSDSTQQTAHRSIDELTNSLQEMADEYSDPNVDVQGLHEDKQIVKEFTEKMIESESDSDSPSESQGIGLTEDFDEIINLKEKQERLEYGIGKKAERLAKRSGYSSTDLGLARSFDSANCG